jgi:hypothetical protein
LEMELHWTRISDDIKIPGLQRYGFVCGLLRPNCRHPVADAPGMCGTQDEQAFGFAQRHMPARRGLRQPGAE